MKLNKKFINNVELNQKYIKVLYVECIYYMNVLCIIKLRLFSNKINFNSFYSKIVTIFYFGLLYLSHRSWW